MGDKSPDLLEALRSEHDRIRKHLDELRSTTDASARRRVLQRVRDELQGHLEAEDDVVLPSLLQVDDGEEAGVLVHGLREEHDLVNHVLRDLTNEPDAAGSRFTGQVQVLCDLVNRHLEREENGLAPLAEEHLDEEERRTLGRQLVSAREQVAGVAG